MSGKAIRALFLVLFIVVYSVSLLMALLAKQIMFMWTLFGLGLVVGGGEIWSVIKTGKTLSTNITKAWDADKKTGIFLTIMCIMLILSMVFLMIHFIPWK